MPNGQRDRHNQGRMVLLGDDVDPRDLLRCRCRPIEPLGVHDILHYPRCHRCPHEPLGVWDLELGPR